MNKRTAIFGGILVLLGALLLVRSVGIFWFDLGDLISTLIPVALIALGIRLIAKKKRQLEQFEPEVSIKWGSPAAGHAPPPPQPPGADPSTFAEQQASSTASPGAHHEAPETRASERAESGPADKQRYSKLLGDMYINASGSSLQDVEVSMGIGDLDLSLAGGRLSKGLNRVVISGFIGDLRVFIPRSMPHCVQCSNFIGDIDLSGKRTSGFGNNVDTQSIDYNDADSRIYIAANSFIGDIKTYLVD
jgi:lia operon protein LiaF